MVKYKTKIESDRLGHLLKLPIFVIQKAAAKKNGVEYQPSGKGGTRSPPAMSHCLQRRNPCSAALPATPH